MTNQITMPFLLAVLSGICYGVSSLGYKMAAQRQSRTPAFVVVFSISGGLITGIIALLDKSSWLEPDLWLLGGSMAPLFNSAIYFIILCNRRGPASMSWTVLNLGLILPIIISPLFLGEQVLWVDPILVVLFAIMVLIFGRGLGGTRFNREKKLSSYFMLLAGLFLSEGLFLFGNKMKFILFGQANTGALTFIVFLLGGILALVTHLAVSRSLLIRADEWAAGGLTGLCSGVGTIFFLSAMSLPSTVVFPTSSLMALVAGILLISYFYREIIDKYMLLGIALGLVVLAFAIFREPIALLWG